MSALPSCPVGDILAEQEYLDDFWPRLWKIDGEDIWKLQRIQSFQEHGSESFDAFVRGNWSEALRLMEARRDSLIEYYQKIADLGCTIYRVRVVEPEIVPNLRWQLHSLRQRHELGERVRIVSKADVAEFETNSVLPEIVTLADSCYQIHFDHRGEGDGGVRSDDPVQLKQWRTFIQNLNSIGEDIDSFMDRNKDRISF